MEELLYEGNLTIFSDNYRALTRTGERFEEMHRIKWELVLEALRATVDPEAKEKAIMGVHNQ